MRTLCHMELQNDKRGVDDEKILLVAIACIIIGVIGISQTYEKAVQTAEKGNKEDIIKNETLKNIEVKLDAGILLSKNLLTLLFM